MSAVLAFAKPNPEKVSKSAVHYRDYPKQMQMCGMCKFFVGRGMMGGGMMGCGIMGGDPMDAPVLKAGMMGEGMMGHGMMSGECQVVEGRISRMGWCDLYVPRGA